MKILFPIGSFYPAQSGGPNNTIYWHTKALTKKGLDCIIITTNQDLEYEQIPFNEYLKKEFGLVNYTTKKKTLFPVKLVLETIKYLGKADVLHLTSIFYPPSWIIAIMSQILYKKKVVWSVRGELDPNALVYSTQKKKIVLLILRFLKKKHIYFHATCKAEEIYIEDNFGKSAKTILLPNLIFFPKKVTNPSQEQYFLFIGRIHHIKALENLIEGLSLSCRFKKSHFNLKIAGNADNTYGKSLKKLVGELNLTSRVVFLGHVTGEKKQELYANAYFTFMPSHTENFGNVVVESLAQGTPVVASRGTPWEILEEYNAGMWTGNSAEELASAMDSILALSQNEYRDMRSNSLDLAKNEFDVEKNIHRWIEKYNAIING